MNKYYNLVDAAGRIIWTSTRYLSCYDARRVLTANPEDVSENDELQWESLLRSAEFVEPLEIETINDE